MNVKLIRTALFQLHLFSLLCAFQTNSLKLSDLVTANNDFGLKLYNKFVETKRGNIIFSPLSISLALAMTSLGAKGQTLEEIHSTLAGGFPEEQIHEQFQQIMKVIPRNNKNEQVSIANKLYAQKGYRILSSFLESTQKFYGSELKTVDFSKPRQCASLINKWVSQKTGKKIKNIVSSDDFSQLTVAVLVNALFFKARWDSPFHERLTKSHNFFTTPKDAVKTEFLHDLYSKVYYGVQETLHFEVLEKDFISREFRFGIILPNLAKSSFQEVEKTLSADTLKSIDLNSVTANVTIPKFKIESSFDLSDNLQQLGIQDLFLVGKADLSGIEKSKKLYVSKTLHKAIVEIDEKGAVAAAVTVVIIAVRSGYIPPDHVINFRADHPFLFYIKHVDTGSILFLGRFVQP